MNRISLQGRAALFVLTSGLALHHGYGQSLGNAGTIEGSVLDPSGASIAGANVTIRNPITGYSAAAKSDSNGAFRLPNIPPNQYHMEVSASGFGAYEQDVNVRTSVPIQLKVNLQLAGAKTTVTVEASGSDILEKVPYAHDDVDRSAFSKLPISSPGVGLSDAITFNTAGVVADANGFFHPIGDHAETTYSIDGQPISDQQSKIFSTQVPLNAIQSMELITSAPNAEYGGKTSLVVDAVTRSGLGAKPFGSFVARYGSFGTVEEQSSLGFGTAKFGNFLVANVLRSGRFLDTPEFLPIHGIGNNGTIFDRLDYAFSPRDTFHLNLYGARNWFQVPNTYDQLGQDQKQRVLTFNIAPGYQHAFGSGMLLSLNPFYRSDQVNYYPSRDPFADTPATLAEQRRLLNWGFRADFSYVKGAHNIKVGTQVMQTRLKEDFSLGITDPLFNAVCVNQNGDPLELPTVTNPSRCAPLGFDANPNLSPGLVPFDLTRGGTLFAFGGKANINEQAFYIQDTITWRNLTLTPGIRVTHYDGLTSDTGAEPRIGAAYHIKRTGTVLRGSYTRAFETPYNENLIISGSTGVGGLEGGDVSAHPAHPGTRNEYGVGLQQAGGKYVLVSADYFWKFTNGAFDFDTLFNTPLVFPIQWAKSKIDGVSVRISTINIHGFQAYSAIGHVRARYFGPETGGLIFNAGVSDAVFRIDHDQAFQQTTHLRYQRPNNGPWFAFTWRYDSGLVSGAVTGVDDALALTAAQQSAIGFFCGGRQATLTNPITSCDASQPHGAVRFQIPKEGTENDDLNPPRVAPRHIFNIGVGTDNLFHRGDRFRTTAKFEVFNLANQASLYNFLSTFSGTHWVTPRSYQAELGFVF
jgi:hypothetical protein